ncbi:hypothetical protein WICPIJ_004359 [Wickerhamomyces pijperi]|uniref:Uncharacterized protein n=1 Tax=Wickerhamomyces pijperi TaxID=599730 RepID=A0A9P8Q7W1_WICPI|nr:hypothetical protein WICPIJ_004359 [Wickerhamomyces pijperi]
MKQKYESTENSDRATRENPHPAFSNPLGRNKTPVPMNAFNSESKTSLAPSSSSSSSSLNSSPAKWPYKVRNSMKFFVKNVGLRIESTSPLFNR